ncbi:PAS domain S-box protein [Synechocystis sp. PCC 7509]|uniref:PAS domain S-box protein n=1 Tax=Synechocystis sp. PCC 7509 TaxID=927677 RepID=UPI0002ACC8EE|nr:PAS domain S-box protein [Synechocystis sp. PCC 7509]
MLESEKEQVKHLLAIEDNRGKRTISLESANYSIGRNPTNSIVLHSQLVSRQHAILVRLTDQSPHLFRLIDGNLKGVRSTNGLRVNGQHCFERELSHEDEIIFADDVKAWYYTTVDSLEISPENREKEVIKVASSTLIGVEREIANYSDAALLKLAAFPEPIANPIIEIDLTGNITYINPSALAQFPDLRETKLQHPLLEEIVPIVKNGQETFFVREVEIGSKIFSQSVHYVAVSGLIRNYIVDITESKHTELALRESEAKNRALLNAIPDLMLRLDKNGNCLNYLPAKTDTDRPNECAILPQEIISQRMHHINRALQTGETQIFEYQLQVQGTTCHHEVRIVVDGEDEVLAIVRDISSRVTAEIELKQAKDELELRVQERTTELQKANNRLLREIVTRHRAEEEVRFLQTMTQSIGESANFHSALGVALRLVCDFTGWAFGEAWIPHGGALECSPAWYRNTQNLDKFRLESENLTFLLGVGLPGRVWSSKQPELMQSVVNASYTDFLRKACALEVGFKSGLGIPIVATDRVLAVLVFFMFTADDEDKHLVKLVSTVATQLGALIQRKQVEEALSDSEERFRLLVEGGKDYAIFMLDIEGNIISWNTGAERITGYTSAEILGRSFYCFYPPEDRAINKPEYLLHLAKVNSQIEDEGWRICKDGSQIWVDEIITALKDQNGQLRGFSKVVRNTTENRRSQQALQESEQRLQAILDNSTALIYVKDLQGRFITINSWFGIVFNIHREEIKGKTDYDLFPKEIADTYRANELKVIETKSPMDWEEVAPQSDGLHTYISIKFPLFDAVGKIYAVCGISTDISDRKRVEDALNSSLATNRALLNAIPDSMFRISFKGIFVNFKAVKNNRLPLPTQEFLGKSLYEVFPYQVANPMMDCVQLALTTKNMQILEYQLLLDDNLLDYEARIAVSAENEVMAIIRDITERKHVETDIRQALEKEKELGELKSRFVTMASHEFRTPLATILSSSELLEYYSHKWSDDKKLKHQQRIQSSVKHMTSLLDDVLLIGKAEAGKLEFQPRLLDIIQLSRDLVEEVQVTTQTHTINFCPQTQWDRLDGLIDEKLFRHIITNLLTNAVKYSPQGKEVDFNLECDRTRAIFSIQDGGIGISIEDQQQLFESFHRGRNVSNIPGTGLGLAIVKKSVDLHGGTITAESQLEVGTKFTVTLPLNQ